MKYTWWLWACLLHECHNLYTKADLFNNNSGSSPYFIYSTLVFLHRI